MNTSCVYELRYRVERYYKKTKGPSDDVKM